MVIRRCVAGWYWIGTVLSILGYYFYTWIYHCTHHLVLLFTFWRVLLILWAWLRLRAALLLSPILQQQDRVIKGISVVGSLFSPVGSGHPEMREGVWPVQWEWRDKLRHVGLEFDVALQRFGGSLGRFLGGSWDEALQILELKSDKFGILFETHTLLRFVTSLPRTNTSLLHYKLQYNYKIKTINHVFPPSSSFIIN